jgi:hypothetical protein
MKMLFILAIFSAFSLISFGQSPVDIVEKSIKVAAMATTTEYYGFAEGDKVIFNFSVEKGKDFKDVTISEYPNNVKFADHNIEKIENKAINIPRKGIYKFEYYNAYFLPRTINIKIQRVPKDETTKSFNTNIKWVEGVDTTYMDQQESFALIADTSFEEVMNSKIKVNAQTIKDTLNKTIIDFVLPANTIKWTWWIGIGEPGLQAFENDRRKMEEIVKVPKSTNPLAGLALGLIPMTRITTGGSIHYYFISSEEETLNFNKGLSFKFFKQGAAVADFGLMNYVNKLPQKYYLGIRNDNIVQGADVNVKILAAVVNTSYKPVIEKAAIYINKKMPVHEQ